MIKPLLLLLFYNTYSFPEIIYFWQSCACLLLATAPRFPSRTVDNQYHLQALRHLYVLAVEQRAVQVVDVDSGGAVSVDIVVEKMDGSHVVLRAPCLLPELTTVHAVHLFSSSSSSSSSSGPAVGATDPSLYYPTSLVITPKQQPPQSPSSPQSPQSPSSSTSAPADPSELSFVPHVLFVKRRPVTSSSGFTTTKIAPTKALATGAGSSSRLAQGQTNSADILPSSGIGAIHELHHNLLTRLVGSKSQQQGMRWIQESAGETQMHLGQHPFKHTPSNTHPITSTLNTRSRTYAYLLSCISCTHAVAYMSSYKHPFTHPLSHLSFAPTRHFAIFGRTWS